MIRMYCITFGCEQSNASCEARHRKARSMEDGWDRGGVAFTCAYGCATCPTGARVAGLPEWSGEQRPMDRSDLYPIRVRQAQRFEAHGENLTLREWERKSGISADVIRSRLDYGWDVAEAVSRPVRKPKTFTIDGRTRTIPDWCREYGKGEGTVRSRLHMGWSIERALGTKVRSRMMA